MERQEREKRMAVWEEERDEDKKERQTENTNAGRGNKQAPFPDTAVHAPNNRVGRRGSQRGGQISQDEFPQQDGWTLWASSHPKPSLKGN